MNFRDWIYNINQIVQMWNILTSIFFKQFFTRLTLPIAVVAGFIGYVAEGYISDKYTPSIPSVQEEREQRLLKESKEIESLKERKFVPKTVFEKNLPPSLLEDDNRGKKYQDKV